MTVYIDLGVIADLSEHSERTASVALSQLSYSPDGVESYIE